MRSDTFSSAWATVNRVGIALGLALAMLVLLLARRWGENWFVDAIPGDSLNEAAARSLWAQVTLYLMLAARAVLVLAVVVLIGALIAGPWRWAASCRAWIGIGRQRPGQAFAGSGSGPPGWPAGRLGTSCCCAR